MKQADAKIFLTVKDGGPGIAEESLPKIFEPYERAVSINNISGAGIGLYICRQIIDAHGGQITAQNILGGGAEFTVELPLT